MTRSPTATDNAATIADVQAAFGRGDVTGSPTRRSTSGPSTTTRVIRFRHYCPTAEHIAATRGADTTVR
jgi:hypothetical protein